MSKFDEQYIELVRDILDNGYYATNRTEDATKKVFGKTLRFNLAEEFPILTVKHTGIKTLTTEALWIYQQQSNDVTWLQERNCHVWDSWCDDKQTIGKAYGYVVDQYSLIDEVIHNLKHNPQSRRMIVNLWDNPHLDEMMLTPCMFLHNADVNDGKLNWHTVIRSSDVGLGLGYNVPQIAVIIHMLARHCNLEVGELMISITNAHLYEQHFEPIQAIFDREPYPAPQLWLNPEKTNFYEFTADDVKLVGYQSHPAIKMRVSV